MGGEPWQLIEPVDGFHPSQVKIRSWEMGRSRWGCQHSVLPQAHGWHTAGIQVSGISLLNEMMALAPGQMSLFQPPALCLNYCKVFCCFLPLIDQYPGQTGLKPQNQTLAAGVLQDQGSGATLGKPERIPPASPCPCPAASASEVPSRTKLSFGSYAFKLLYALRLHIMKSSPACLASKDKWQGKVYSQK